MADLLTIMHDIDRLRGKVCGSCKFWQSGHNWQPKCYWDMKPLDAQDGCDEWQPSDTAKRNAKLTAAIVGSLCLLAMALPSPSEAQGCGHWEHIRWSSQAVWRPSPCSPTIYEPYPRPRPMPWPPYGPPLWR